MYVFPFYVLIIVCNMQCLINIFIVMLNFGKKIICNTCQQDTFYVIVNGLLYLYAKNMHKEQDIWQLNNESISHDALGMIYDHEVIITQIMTE